MSDHYDRAGDRISFGHWLLLFEDRRYQVLAYDIVGLYRVSTVWMGIDHGFGDEPIIFETMVFRLPQLGILQGAESVEGRRYATEEEALAGHAELLNEVALLAALEEVEL